MTEALGCTIFIVNCFRTELLQLSLELTCEWRNPLNNDHPGVLTCISAFPYNVTASAHPPSELLWCPYNFSRHDQFQATSVLLVFLDLVSYKCPPTFPLCVLSGVSRTCSAFVLYLYSTALTRGGFFHKITTVFLSLPLWLITVLPPAWNNSKIFGGLSVKHRLRSHL